LQVKVRYISSLRDISGKAEEILTLQKGKTIADLKEELATKYSKDLVDENSVIVMLNDKGANTPERLKTSLKEGDIITLLPMIAGG